MIPKITILLATHNGEKWIGSQLESIINQEDVNLNICISDDNSIDSTLEIAHAYANSSFVDFKIVSGVFGGAGKNFYSMIRSIDIGDSDYVALSDQDDIWLSDKMKRAIACLNASGYDCYSSSVKSRWPNGKEVLLIQSKEITDFDFVFEGAGQGCTFVIKRDFFVHLKSFVDINFEMVNKFHYHDWMIYAFCRMSNKLWYFDDYPSMIYRQHSNNDTGARISFNGIFSRLGKICNGWYRLQILILLNIFKSHKNFSPDLMMVQDLLAGNRVGFSPFLKIISNSRRRLSDKFIVFFIILFGF
jgi:rhamnosyltransferase